MDESHRLKTMVENYDPQLFNQLYADTKNLRKKLAYGIDPKKYGVDYYEVLSWFDVKFIYAFNKYYNDERVIPDRPNRLKGFIINSLSMFSRLNIVESYKAKQHLNNTVDITELFNYDSLLIEQEGSPENTLLQRVIKYLKERLSDEAYFLFDLELNPPPYILTRLANADQKKLPKTPIGLITEYLGMEENEESIAYIKALRREIESIKKQAKEYFSIKEYQST